MYKGNRSKFFPIVVIIVVIAIVVFGVVSLIRFFLGGQTSESTEVGVDTVSSKLLDTSSTQSVRMVVRGPIVGDEEFRSFQIVISPTGRSITAWKGYDRSDVIETKSYSNDSAAYEEFVNALAYAGYAKSSNVDSDDTSGLCANGKVYNFIIMDGGNSVDDRWTTNCGVKGSFAGSGPNVRQLFLNQIPDADTITSEVNL